MKTLRAETAGVILVTLAAVCWSMGGLFTRLVAADTWAILGWRGVFSVVWVLLYLLWRDRGLVPRAFASVGWAGMLAASLSTLASVAYIAALRLTSVANVMVIFAALPFITAGLGWLLLRERPAGRTLLAAGVALAGVCVMVGGGGARGAGFGLVLSLAMTVGMGLLTVIGRWSRGVSMIPATCVSAVQLAVIGVVATPLLAVSARDIAVLAVFAMTQSAALACYMEGARRLSASRSALLSALDVPLGPLWVLLLVGEVPPLATVAGGVIVLAAVMWDIVRAGQPASVSA